MKTVSELKKKYCYTKLIAENIIPKHNFAEHKTGDGYSYPATAGKALYTHYGSYIELIIRRDLWLQNNSINGLGDMEALIKELFNKKLQIFIGGLSNNKNYFIQSVSASNRANTLFGKNYLELISSYIADGNSAPLWENFITAKSYAKYINRALKTEDILVDIWPLVEAEEMLYVEDSNPFIYAGLPFQDYIDVYENVPRDKNIYLNGTISAFNLRGDYDYMVEGERGYIIVDIKNKSQKNLADAYVQLMLYAMIARENKMVISDIAIWNPLKGYYWIMDITRIDLSGLAKKIATE